jgi:hypothetical protein
MRLAMIRRPHLAKHRRLDRKTAEIEHGRGGDHLGKRNACAIPLGFRPPCLAGRRVRPNEQAIEQSSDRPTEAA